jgi:hypothetical protein
MYTYLFRPGKISKLFLSNFLDKLGYLAAILDFDQFFLLESAIYASKKIPSIPNPLQFHYACPHGRPVHFWNALYEKQLLYFSWP